MVQGAMIKITIQNVFASFADWDLAGHNWRQWLPGK
jgi:hypothetical protein